jgi:hypothetical protein
MARPRHKIGGVMQVQFYCRKCKAFCTTPHPYGYNWVCGNCGTHLEPEARCDPARVRLQTEAGRVVVIPDVKINEETGVAA